MVVGQRGVISTCCFFLQEKNVNFLSICSCGFSVECAGTAHFLKRFLRDRPGTPSSKQFCKKKMQRSSKSAKFAKKSLMRPNILQGKPSSTFITLFWSILVLPKKPFPVDTPWASGQISKFLSGAGKKLLWKFAGWSPLGASNLSNVLVPVQPLGAIVPALNTTEWQRQIWRMTHIRSVSAVGRYGSLPTQNTPHWSSHSEWAVGPPGDSFFCTSFDSFPAYVSARYAGEVKAKIGDGTLQDIMGMYLQANSPISPGTSGQGRSFFFLARRHSDFSRVRASEAWLWLQNLFGGINRKSCVGKHVWILNARKALDAGLKWVVIIFGQKHQNMGIISFEKTKWNLDWTLDREAFGRLEGICWTQFLCVTCFKADYPPPPQFIMGQLKSGSRGRGILLFGGGLLCEQKSNLAGNTFYQPRFFFLQFLGQLRLLRGGSIIWNLIIPYFI